MANIKHFADMPNGETIEFSRVDYRGGLRWQEPRQGRRLPGDGSVRPAMTSQTKNPNSWTPTAAEREAARERFEREKAEAYASMAREAARRTRAQFSGDDW